MAIVTVGIDLAKNVFAVHGVDETGKPALVRAVVKRAALLELIAELAPCLVWRHAQMCTTGPVSAKFGHACRLDDSQVRDAVMHRNACGGRPGQCLGIK